MKQNILRKISNTFFKAPLRPPHSQRTNEQSEQSEQSKSTKVMLEFAIALSWGLRHPLIVAKKS